MSQDNWKQHTFIYNKVYRPLFLEEEEKLSRGYGYNNLIKDLKFSPDNSHIALISEVDYNEQKLYIVTIDGTLVYRGSINYEYDVWEGRSKPRTHMSSKIVLIKKVQWSPDGRLVWCATNEGLYEFSLETKQFRRLYTERKERDVVCFTDIAVNSSDKVMAVLGYETDKAEHGSIYFLTLNGSLIRKIDDAKHPPAYYGYDRIVYSSDFTKLFTLGDDKVLRIWDVTSGELTDEHEIETDSRIGDLVQVSGKNQLLCFDHYIHFDNQGKITEAEKKESSFCLVNDGKHMVASTTGGVFDLEGKEIGLIESCNNVYAANNQDLVALINHRSIDFYMGRESGTQYNLIHEERLASKAHAAVFSNDNKMIAVFGKGVYIGTLDGKPLYEGTLMKLFDKEYWNLDPPKNYQKTNWVAQAVWSGDDKFLWCATQQGLYLFSVDDEEFTAVFPDYTLYCIAVNHEKEYIAVAGYPATESGRKILMFDFNGNLIREIISPHTDGYINNLYFSRDYTRIITTCTKGYLRVFDETTGELLDHTSHSFKEFFLTFNDNQFLLNHGVGGRWHLMTLNEEGKIDELKEIQRSQLKYYLPENVANFIKDNYYYSIGSDQFTLVGTDAEIFAKIWPESGKVDPPIKFYSSKPRESFIEGIESELGWVKEKTVPVTGGTVQIFTQLEKFPGKWLRVIWHDIALFDEEFNKEAVYDFRRPQDGSSVSFVLIPCDFNARTQKLVTYAYNSSLSIYEYHVIDFNALDDFSSLNERKHLYRPVTYADFDAQAPVMLKWSPDGTKIAAIEDHGHHLIIYNDKLEEIFRQKFDLRHGPRNMEWSPSGDRIALGFYQGIIHIYNINDRITERVLPTVDIEDINGMEWNSETGELIVTSNRYINVFNNDGYIIRKMDLRDPEMHFDKTTCKPGSKLFAVVSKANEDHNVYIIDRNKPIRESVVCIIPYMADSISHIHFGTDGRLFVHSNVGLTFWKEK
ncbi:MAG: hypothetical protein ACFFD4_19950 [Candidatus Odinarchaeota archaeon]